VVTPKPPLRNCSLTWAFSAAPALTLGQLPVAHPPFPSLDK